MKNPCKIPSEPEFGAVLRWKEWLVDSVTQIAESLIEMDENTRKVTAGDTVVCVCGTWIDYPSRNAYQRVRREHTPIGRADEGHPANSLSLNGPLTLMRGPHAMFVGTSEMNVIHGPLQELWLVHRVVGNW